MDYSIEIINKDYYHEVLAYVEMVSLPPKLPLDIPLISLLDSLTRYFKNRRRK
jgi:hypothetical protein